MRNEIADREIQNGTEIRENGKSEAKKKKTPAPFSLYIVCCARVCMWVVGRTPSSTRAARARLTILPPPREEAYRQPKNCLLAGTAPNDPA